MDAEILSLVAELTRRLDLEARLEPYAAHRWRGGSSGLPVLQVDDVSGIPFVHDVPGVEEYQHRARVRARSGDLFVAVTPQSEGYEEYCRGRLRLGEPRFVLAEGADHGYAVAAACFREPTFQRLVDAARSAGGLAIHPYMAIEEVWRLAAELAAASGVSVEVVGPPPPTLWIANDKALLTEITAGLLSDAWVVESFSSSEPDVMAARLAELARRHRRVGLKRARCASGLGNGVWEGEAIRAMAQDGVASLVGEFLSRTEWPGDEEVVVVAWEDTDCSPSVQTWVPPAGHGGPVLEGVYEQILEGEQKIFVGSRPSSLPGRVNETLGDAAVRVATALQALGYVGRCSFDAILLGDPEGEFQLKFTECNGRWGGTSTPMHLVDRVVGRVRPPYRAQDWMHEELVGATFAEVVAALGDALYDAESGRGSYILYNVGPLARTGKLDVVAVAASHDAADDLIHDDLPRRLGVSGHPS
jgi:hypothetical protein